MRVLVLAMAALATAALLFGSASVTAATTGGAELVGSNGCSGCHGAQLAGTSTAPSLVGIEHRRSAEQIAASIRNPKAPMPRYPFSEGQIAAVVSYLTSLDGGSSGMAPVVTITPPKPGKMARISVRFSGKPPQRVSVASSMKMGDSTMSGDTVSLTPSADRRVWHGTVHFSMSGAWTLVVHYDKNNVRVPVNVGGSTM